MFNCSPTKFSYMKKITILLLSVWFFIQHAQAQCSLSISKPSAFVLCSSDSVLLSASTGFTRYIWSSGESTREIYAKKEGYYRVIAKDANNCIAVDSILIIKFPKPSFLLTGASSCDSSSFTFTNTTNIALAKLESFTWIYGDGASYQSSLPINNTDSLRWVNPYTHKYKQEGVFNPQLIVKYKSNANCIDTFSYVNSGSILPENIKYKVDIKSIVKNSSNKADSLCYADGNMIGLFNKYPLMSKGGVKLNSLWTFADAQANPPGSDRFLNIDTAYYQYKAQGQFFPTLTVMCPNGNRVYSYYSRIDTLPSSNKFNPPANNLTTIYTIGGKVFSVNDTIFLKRNIYNANTIIDSFSSKWSLFNTKQADTLKRVAVKKLYGYGVNIGGSIAIIENSNTEIVKWQKAQCGPTFPVQFTNVSKVYLSDKIFQYWDFDDKLAPACTSYSAANPSASNAGKAPYIDANDLQNRTLGMFVANGKTYQGRLNNCRFSLDTLPTKSFHNWDVVYDWYVYGHDFPPYDASKWSIGYTTWPTTQSPPVGKNWVQPRDTNGGSTWGKWNTPFLASGTVATRIDTIQNIWPADILPNKTIVLDHDIPDPIAAKKGYWNFIISAGHSIAPNGIIFPNDLGNLPNGQTRNYNGTDLIPGTSTSLYRYVFNRIVAKDYNVSLSMVDSVAVNSNTAFKCNSKSNVLLSFARPDAYGMGKDGREIPGYLAGQAGGNAQFVFDSLGFIDKGANKKAPGISPSYLRTYLSINYDSLLDRNDATPCDLDNFVGFDGGTTPGGLTMPGMFNRVNYSPLPGGPWTSASGNRAYVHYFPNGPTPAGISNMPYHNKGWVTIGLIVGTGCASPGNCSFAGCLSDTVWYHNFFRYVSVNAGFALDSNVYKNSGRPSEFCSLRKKGDVVTVYYEDTIQDNVLADIWYWGDGTATIDSFYYTTSSDVPSGRKRFELDVLYDNSKDWKILSTTIIPGGAPVTNKEIEYVWRCDDPLHFFPPLRIDTVTNTYYPGFMLRPMSHTYRLSSAEMKVPFGNNNPISRGDITPVTHQMFTNTTGNGSSVFVKYITVGVMDTFTIVTNNIADTVFCVGTEVQFRDSIRYWYSGGTGACTRPLQIPGENNDYLIDLNDKHGWAYTKYSYPTDTVKTAVNPKKYYYIEGFNTCPTGWKTTTGTDTKNKQYTLCQKIETFYYERIYWDFQTDGIIDAIGKNPKYKFASPGVFKVSMISRDSTGAFDTCFIKINIKPGVSSNILADSTLICGGTSEITDVTGSFTDYRWKYNNEPLPFFDNLNVIYTPYEGLYSVTARSLNGCAISDQTYVSKMANQNIIGLTNVNKNTTANYSIAAYPNHKYSWQIKGGGITAGQGTPNVSVLWGNSDSNAWLKVVDSLNTCLTTDSIRVIINGSIGVQTVVNNSGFIVYPNPANDKLFISPIQTMEGEYFIRLMTIDGRVIKIILTKEFATNISIDVGDISDGLYMLKISNEQSQFVYRFVKQ